MEYRELKRPVEGWGSKEVKQEKVGFSFPVLIVSFVASVLAFPKFWARGYRSLYIKVKSNG